MQQQAIEKIIVAIFRELNIIIKAAEGTLFSASKKAHTLLEAAVPSVRIEFNKLHLPTVQKWFEMASVESLLINKMISRLDDSIRTKINTISK